MTGSTKVLATDLKFGEGPRWHESRLWFSDFYTHTVNSVSLDGDVRVELELDDQPSGLGWTPEGDLLVVGMTKRQVLRRTSDGAVVVHADLSGIATFYCNDMVVDAKGRAYIGNFGFDLAVVVGRDGPGADFAAETQAKLALVEADGSCRVVAEDMHFPNGSVITPDGRTLIIAETFGRRLTAFEIAADGGLSNRRIWADLGERLPDGICLDAEGAVWIANAAAPECVRIGEGGKVLDRVETSQPCYACMLGGEDGRTLFMMTAPPLFPDPDNPQPPHSDTPGKIEIAEVTVGRAGLP